MKKHIEIIRNKNGIVEIYVDGKETGEIDFWIDDKRYDKNRQKKNNE